VSSSVVYMQNQRRILRQRDMLRVKVRVRSPWRRNKDRYKLSAELWVARRAPYVTLRPV
jgi:hypothetical protein